MVKRKKNKYGVYNSHTARSIIVETTSMENARAIGKKRIGTKTGIIRAYLIKKK